MRAIAALVLFASLGCSQLAVRRGPAETAQAVEDQSKVETLIQHRLFWGLWPLSPPAVLVQACAPGRWVRVENEIRAAQVPWHILTLGIYSPWTVRIFCYQSPSK